MIGNGSMANSDSALWLIRYNGLGILVL